MTAPATADAFADEMDRLEALFDLRKPDARGQAQRALTTRLVQAQGLRLAEGSRYIRGQDQRSDTLGLKAELYEREAAAIADLLERRADWNPFQEDQGTTAESHVKTRREDPILYLWKKGTIDDRQREAAHHINEDFYELTKPLFAKAQTIVTPTGVRTRGFRPPAEMRVAVDQRRQYVYRPWAHDLDARGGRRVELTILVVVDGSAPDTAARILHMPYGRAMDRLLGSLDVYAQYLEGWRRHRDVILDSA